MKQRGFTLLEIIIAVAIFAIISIVISTVLYVIINAQENIQNTTERLSQLQMAMSMIEQDVSQIALKNFHDENNRTIGPMNANQESFSITTSSYVNPDARFARSELRRISYVVEEGNLYRISEPLKVTEGEAIQKRLILQHVNQMRLRYLTQNNRWLPRMGSYMVSFVSDSTIRLLPKGIEIQLDVETWGTVEIFCLIGAMEFVQ